jgi:hypothetical protein
MPVLTYGPIFFFDVGLAFRRVARPGRRRSAAIATFSLPDQLYQREQSIASYLLHSSQDGRHERESRFPSFCSLPSFAHDNRFDLVLNFASQPQVWSRIHAVRHP